VRWKGRLWRQNQACALASHVWRQVRPLSSLLSSPALRGPAALASVLPGRCGSAAASMPEPEGATWPGVAASIRIGGRRRATGPSVSPRCDMRLCARAAPASPADRPRKLSANLLKANCAQSAVIQHRDTCLADVYDRGRHLMSHLLRPQAHVRQAIFPACMC